VHLVGFYYKNYFLDYAHRPVSTTKIKISFVYRSCPPNAVTILFNMGVQTEVQSGTDTNGPLTSTITTRRVAQKVLTTIM